MLYKFIALSVVFGLILADPVAKITPPSFNDLQYETPYLPPKSKTLELVAAKTDLAVIVLDILTSLIGYKASALTIAVKVIEWLVSNFVLLAIGAITTLGFCKITDKCNFFYDKFVPITPFRDLVTPEQLETAEDFLVSAVEKYAQERKGKSMKTAQNWS